MGCCQCQGGANVFGKKSAEWQLKGYRKSGPDRTTRMLIEALRAEGVEGLSLLDIGGGVGAIAWELLKSGVSEVTAVDASPAYVAVAREEAAREGVADRVAWQEGDFVALAGEVPAAGIVTLDRVICCYPDMPALVGASASKATRLYGAVYPRDTWWFRLVGRVFNVVQRVRRDSFRFYAHPTTAVDATIRGHGLTPRYHRETPLWQVVVYARAAGAR